jgi:hypothetical protein
MLVSRDKEQCSIKLNNCLNQSSGYDVHRCHAVQCIVVAMTSIHVTHISNYSVVDIMQVGDANLCIVLARCSSYFRV